MKRLALVAIALLLGAAVPAGACGLSETCGDVGASLSGNIIISGITVSWHTDAEDSSVYGYRLRYWTGTAWLPLSLYFAGQGCPSNAPYQATANGIYSGTFRVEVLDSSQAVVCHHDVAL